MEIKFNLPKFCHHPKFNLPKFNLPKFSLPKFNRPKFNLKKHKNINKKKQIFNNHTNLNINHNFLPFIILATPSSPTPSPALTTSILPPKSPPKNTNSPFARA